MRPSSGETTERADELHELHDRAGPAVGDDQRQRARLGRPDVHKVHVLAVDDGGELGELVQPGLVGAPVVIGAPVGGQVFEVVQRYPGFPAGAGQLVGPARAGEPVGQVVQVGLGHVDPERPDLGVGMGSSGHGRVLLPAGRRRAADGGGVHAAML